MSDPPPTRFDHPRYAGSYSPSGTWPQVGHERWRGTNGGLHPPAASEDGIISVGSDTLAAYTPAGERLWTFEMERGDAPASAGYVMDPSIALAHGMVYVTLSDSRIYGIGGS